MNKFMEENRCDLNIDVHEKDAEKNDKNQDRLKVTKGLSMSDSINKSIKKAANEYAKPTTYDRSYFDDAQAKIKAKQDLFKEKRVNVDPYSGKRLVENQEQAKKQFRGKWQDHAPEADHKVPLKRVYEENKNNPWLKISDLQEIANSPDNINVISRTINNAKRDRTNQELVEDIEYIKAKKLPLTEEGKQKAISEGKKAAKAIKQKIINTTAGNVITTGHEAGMMGAQNAGSNVLAMSGIMNIVSVIKGEKSGTDAIKDTVEAGGKAAISGYVVDSSMTVVAHTLSASSSKFIQALVKSNVPGNVVAAVTTWGDTFKKYAQGELSTQELLLEVGEKGLNIATMGYYTAVGQSLIPIPIIGGAIGAFVGSMLTSTYFNRLMFELKQKELEHQERLRIIEECEKATEQLKKFHEELESYLAAYFKEYQDCFDSALSNMKLAYQMDNAQDIITSANEITYRIGGAVKFESVDEFKDFVDSELVDEL